MRGRGHPGPHPGPGRGGHHPGPAPGPHLGPGMRRTTYIHILRLPHA